MGAFSFLRGFRDPIILTHYQAERDGQAVRPPSCSFDRIKWDQGDCRFWKAISSQFWTSAYQTGLLSFALCHSFIIYQELNIHACLSIGRLPGQIGGDPRFPQTPMERQKLYRAQAQGSSTGLRWLYHREMWKPLKFLFKGVAFSLGVSYYPSDTEPPPVGFSVMGDKRPFIHILTFG